MEWSCELTGSEMISGISRTKLLLPFVRKAAEFFAAMDRELAAIPRTLARLHLRMPAINLLHHSRSFVRPARPRLFAVKVSPFAWYFGKERRTSRGITRHPMENCEGLD